MSQPKPSIIIRRNARHEFTVRVESESQLISTIVSSAETEKTAYKRAAAKLRKLANEAERLAEES